MKRWSLRARYLLVLILLMLTVFGTITFLIVSQNTNTLRNDLIYESKSFAALSTQPIGNVFVTYQNSGTIKIGEEVSSFTDLDHDINLVEVISASGKQLFTNNTSSSINVNVNDAASVSPTYIYNKNGDLVDIVEPYLESYGIHSYDVVYGISYTSVNRSVRDTITSIIGLSVGILLVSLVIWYFLINWLFLRPVAHVSHVALQISKGDLDKQVHLNRNDEIGDLAAAVDAMASSLKADITKLKQIDELKSEFLMITAHSLRTPLTIIEGYIDNFKDMQAKDNPGPIDLDTIEVNIKRLGHFAEDALTISTMEVSQSHVALTPVEIAPILQDIAEEFTTVAKQKKIHFTPKIDTKAWVNLNNPYFHSAIWNLLDNAYKFTAENGEIELTATTVGTNVEIVIKDNGIGIAEKEVPRLFTKFHRGTDTLNYNYEGTGIGLYLTKLIVEQHAGTIEVETREGEGSKFTMKLPTTTPVETEHAK